MVAAARWEHRAAERALAPARARTAERGRRLVDAARTLAANGSTTLTIGEVAAEAGMSVRSFYRHFGSRDELLLALFEEEARVGAVLLEQELEGVDAPLDRLRAYVVGLASLMVAGSGYASLLVQEHLRLADSHPDELRAALAPLVDLLGDELRAAASVGDLRPIDGIDVATVFALLLTQVQTVALLEPSATTDATAAHLWAFCHAALAPDPMRETR